MAFLNGESLMGFRSLPQDRQNLALLYRTSEESEEEDFLSNSLMEDAFIKFYEDLQRFF